MGKPISSEPKTVTTYTFEDNATALALKNSRGAKKGRLHLLEYHGLGGMDRYAVAAEVMQFKPEEEKKLGTHLNLLAKGLEIIKRLF